jgi:hypothetical protein
MYRRYASSHTRSFIEGFANAVGARQPGFRVPQASIRILRQPAEFYRSLLVRYYTPLDTVKAIYVRPLGHDWRRRKTNISVFFIHWNG